MTLCVYREVWLCYNIEDKGLMYKFIWNHNSSYNRLVAPGYQSGESYGSPL